MPAVTLKHISHADWEREGERRFGHRLRDWAFVCPSCGHRQTGGDFVAAGLKPEDVGRYLGFSCIGRFIAGSRDAFSEGPGPCNYAGGGLIRIAPNAVDVGKDEPVYVFDFADDPLAD